MLRDMFWLVVNLSKALLGVPRYEDREYVPMQTVKSSPVVIDCTFVKAHLQGFGGSPEQWKELKAKYVEQLTPEHSVIDCNNILFDGRDYLVD